MSDCGIHHAKRKVMGWAVWSMEGSVSNLTSESNLDLNLNLNLNPAVCMISPELAGDDAM